MRIQKIVQPNALQYLRGFREADTWRAQVFPPISSQQNGPQHNSTNSNSFLPPRMPYPPPSAPNSFTPPPITNNYQYQPMQSPLSSPMQPPLSSPMQPPLSSSLQHRPLYPPPTAYNSLPSSPPPPPTSLAPQPYNPPTVFPQHPTQPLITSSAQRPSYLPTPPMPVIENKASVYNNEMIDLLKATSVVSSYVEEAPTSSLLSEDNQQMNCSSDVIQGTKIVRCDSCKSYINPFVTFLDNTRWRCSICFRVNNLPQEFLFDPVTKTYGDPARRPEVRFGTVEYTATADYMARPPQPAMYLFLLDVSHNAVQTGYLQSFCDILYENLGVLPGDARTQIGFLTFDSRLHFYDLSERQNGTFRMMIAPDLENIENDFLPLPDGLMVTLSENRSAVETFLNELPKTFKENYETDSALGAALQIALKLLSPTGGRVTVVQTRIPNINPGSLQAQQTQGGGGKEPTNVSPTSDYYKKVSLDYASQQIACDLFLLNSHYADLATLSCISKYSGGEIKYYPGYHSVQSPNEVERFENDLRRYLQRKIGFEAVMRLRCPPALSIHTFHGNGFVRSVDLLVLPNINPDAAFGMQVSIEDSLTNYTTVTFQAALLYTSSKSERRIRVHTLSLPVGSILSEIFTNVDQEAVVSLVSKMATDRSLQSSLQEAREAMCNVAVDVLKACATHASNRAFTLFVPPSLRLLPLYMLSMIKSVGFRTGSGSRLDDRAYFLSLCKTMPTQYLRQIFYPDLYPIHTIEDKNHVIQDGEDEVHIPQRVHLSFQHIDSHGAYIMDACEYIYIYIGKAISDHFVQNVFNVQTFSSLLSDSYSLPELDNSLSVKIQNFLSYLIQDRPHGVAIHILREDSPNRYLFTRHLVDDKSESTMSYVEFLRYVRDQIVK
ncbi:unnamed protein product [Didymodactylos carnosus]|uniref:Uncharacterized protein n=1 Tax=Didymodactylos carnosus TaxID=1234261 RepID=A0A8S2CRH1_9BILA|nr:unnamed protein product [Didymodactylos carnosus]CAF3522601.1 unnamed protein product [Didymodactylos carnosus]